MQVTTEEIITRLVSSEGYTEHGATLLAEQLQACVPQVQAALERWRRGEGLDPSLSVQGYTLQRFVEEYGFTAPNALVTMDWLIRDPKEALSALAHYRLMQWAGGHSIPIVDPE